MTIWGNIFLTNCVLPVQFRLCLCALKLFLWLVATKTLRLFFIYFWFVFLRFLSFVTSLYLFYIKTKHPSIHSIHPSIYLFLHVCGNSSIPLCLLKTENCWQIHTINLAWGWAFSWKINIHKQARGLPLLFYLFIYWRA